MELELHNKAHEVPFELKIWKDVNVCRFNYTFVVITVCKVHQQRCGTSPQDRNRILNDLLVAPSLGS